MNLKERMDLDGIKLAKQSYREYSAPCPWCGGSDRFRVWPIENGGRFWCRVCNRSGDMVKYHMLSTGMHYSAACYDLGLEPRFRFRHANMNKFEKAVPPPLSWRCQAAEFIEKAHSMLMSPKGARMRSWLAERGIHEQSIIKIRLGINPADRYFNRSAWGLKEEVNENTGNPKTIWIPAGLVIPCHVSGDPIRIRVRRNGSKESGRYVTVSGSGKQPMRLGRLNRVILVESELDAILISQMAGDLASAVALGSVSVRPDAETHDFLKTAEIIILSLDFDEAGARNGTWWSRQYGPKIKLWPVPTGKDPGEAYQAGVNLRIWVRIGLERMNVQDDQEAGVEPAFTVMITDDK